MAEQVAAELGAEWCDIDGRIEAATGQSVTALFASRGEPAFRNLERQAMAAALAEPPQIIASGGGWAAQPGNLAGAELVALTIYLQVTPELAATRLGGAAGRPLLADDPLPRLRALLAEREAWYSLAGLEVAADGPLELVAGGVVTAARQYAGWLR